MTRVKPSNIHSNNVIVNIEENFVYYPDIDRKIYYDKALATNLLIYKRGVKHDRDCVAAVIGKPGSGKSVLTQQCAKFVDPTFNESRIFFSGEEFIRKLSAEDTPKYTAWVYDEAREGLSARNSMSKTNKIIVDCLAEIRQKNLYIFVVLPDFWDLDANVAKKRTRFLLHVLEIPREDAGENEDPWERGFFQFYNERDKNRLYIMGKKNFHEMSSWPPTFWGRFQNQYVVDEANYRRLKHDALRTNKRLEEFQETNATKLRRKVLLKLLVEIPGRSKQYYADFFDVDDATIYRDMKILESEGLLPSVPGGLPLIT